MANSYYSGINLNLLNGIQKPPSKCLEIGCANGRLGAEIKSRYPDVYYVGVDNNAEAVANASRYLDRAIMLDLSLVTEAELKQVLCESQFDLIIAGDFLEHLPNPVPLLDLLRSFSSDAAELLVCIPNSTHYSVITRLMTGDFEYDDIGLLDRTHLKLYSPSSILKAILDSGWMPSIYDTINVAAPNDVFHQNLMNLAASIGIPHSRVAYNMQAYQLLIRAHKSFLNTPAVSPANNSLAVVCPVNREWQYALNLAKSPGLREIGCEIIEVYGAKSAAEAFKLGVEKTSAEYIMLAHQDIYLPRYSGYLMSEYLSKLINKERESLLIGFVGLEGCSPHEPNWKPKHIRGLVLDRTASISGGHASSACSIDELAIILHRDSSYHIDASLGWHLWATDLCLQSLSSQASQKPIIVNIPIMHNSLLQELPNEWKASASLLASKWPSIPRIHTLCGPISK